tara:strand:- start:18563 stop:19051 length:489 start_codon:yes stop_codon:yes gene_type:complete
MARPKKNKLKEPKRELKISAIENGTVIDHIPADATFQVAEILQLDEHQEGVISIAINLTSSAIGKKGIVKVADKDLTETEVNKISVVAPDASVNIIKNYDVVEKEKVKIPEIIENVIKCSNPACITNNEETRTKFYITDKSPLKVKCHYCEKEMTKEDIKIV